MTDSMDYAKGIDISVYQNYRLANGHPDLSRPVDFVKMKAQGISFAYVRATTIDGGIDYAFDHNWAGLKSVGIPRGAYGFANQKDPIGYARKMHEIVQATGDLGELPPALDYALWVASYSAVNNAPKWMPLGWSSWLLWQQGTPATGKAHGVCSEEIDVDVFNGNEDDFRLWAGLEKPEPVSSWEQEIDAWARGMGYNGPRP